MKRFLLVSLMLHALLLMSWPALWTLQPARLTLQTLNLQLQGPQRARQDHRAQQTAQTAMAQAAEHLVADRGTPARAIPSRARTQPQAVPVTAPLPQPDPAVAAQPADTSQETALSNVRAALADALRANFSYPRRARLRGWQGTVVIALRILPDGAVTDVHVSGSSGIGVLDEAAVRSVSALQIPEAAGWMDGHALAMLIPVEYRLTDG
jgi:TonB family protein